MARRKSRRNPPPESRFKPYDTISRELLEHYAANWLQFLGIRADIVQVIDADLSSIIAPSDKLVRIEEPGPFLAQIEMQSNYEKGLPEHCLEYAVLARCQHRLPVVSVLVLLRPEADGPGLTGRWEQRLPGCQLPVSSPGLHRPDHSASDLSRS